MHGCAVQGALLSISLQPDVISLEPTYSVKEGQEWIWGKIDTLLDVDDRRLSPCR